MKHVKRNIKYTVRKADVTLSITVGEGQVGSTSVLRDGKPVASAGGILVLNLGPGANLVDSTVSISTLAQDVLAETNRVTVSYALSGGEKQDPSVSKAVVDNDFDFCRFTTTVSFVGAK